MSAEHIPEGQPGRKRAVVLIVEDERSIASFVAQAVDDAGQVPMVATNGNDALELVHEQWPDLVLTDLMMPRRGGASLVRALRLEAGARSLPMPPVILMTAASPIYAEAIRADALLRKPFDLTELDAVLRLFLG